MKKSRKRRKKKNYLKNFFVVFITASIISSIVGLGVYLSEKNRKNFFGTSGSNTSGDIVTTNDEEQKINKNEILEEEYNRQLLESLGKDYDAYKNLATLYLQEGRYEEGVDLVENIKFMPRKKILSIKKDFYKDYGDYLYADKQFLESLDAYDKAMIYRKKYDKNLPLDEIKDSIFGAYVELSMQAVENEDYGAAINYLNTALNYKQAAEAYYKLAILYMNKDLYLALRYFEITQKLDPTIINYQLYMRTIVKLKHRAKDPSDMMLYAIKESKLKRFINYIQISPNEFEITFSEPKITKKFLSRTKDVELSFDVKNNSEFITRQLYFQIEASDKDKVFDSQNIVIANRYETIPINAKSATKSVVLKIPKDQKNLTIKVYASKKRKMHMEKVFIQNITLSK